MMIMMKIEIGFRWTENMLGFFSFQAWLLSAHFEIRKQNILN